MVIQKHRYGLREKSVVPNIKTRLANGLNTVRLSGSFKEEKNFEMYLI